MHVLVLMHVFLLTPVLVLVRLSVQLQCAIIQRPCLHCPRVFGISECALSHAFPYIARTYSESLTVSYPTPWLTVPVRIPYGARDTSAAECTNFLF